MAENIKPKEDKKKAEPGYHPDGDEKKVWEEYTRRKTEMMDNRKNINGVDIDALMNRVDRNYFNRTATSLAKTDLDINIEPISMNRAFRKVQAALSILMDRNPKVFLKNDSEKYAANRELMKALANSSWDKSNSLSEYKLSIFNMAKRGWFAGRTFNRKLVHDARFMTEIDDNGKPKYETKEISKMDEIAYMNLDNRNVWFDEEARPFDMLSMRDAMHREIWHIDKVRTVFPEEDYPNMKFVKEGGDISEVKEVATSSSGTGVDSAKETKEGLTEIFFYENQYDDWYIVEINGVMVVWEPLPQLHKRLSYVTGLWNIRDAETIYGVGVVEMMEKSEELLDYILNASLRQLVMTINPPGFYSGTEDFENENIKLVPGVLRRTTNPQDINFVEIPEMKDAGLSMMDRIQSEQDSDTGLTAPIEGDMGEGTGSDTAFEYGVSREAALKRLRLPLYSLKAALEWEFMNRIDLIKQVYSVFDVRHIADEEEILDYMEEVDGDEDFYFIENRGNPKKEKFYANNFREVRVNVDKGDDDEFIESNEEKFFRIKPQWLSWEGDVEVDINSILISEELERADVLRMTNLILPMLQYPKELAKKPAIQLLTVYNKEPEKWLPDDWLAEEEPQQPQAVQPGGNTQPGAENLSEEAPSAETVIPEQELEGQPSIGQRISRAFRR